jgi:hypothetical protein
MQKSIDRMRLLAPLLLLLASCGSKPAAETKREEPVAPPKITHFYPNANPVPQGDAVTICYGTEDATAVSLSPYNDTLGPSLNRCISLEPRQETTYTLTAKGPGGETKAELTLQVGAPKSKPSANPLITNFTSIAAPGKFNLCYSTVPGVSRVTLSPHAPVPLSPGQNICFSVNPSVRTTYVLTAETPAGAADKMQVTVP